MSHPERDRFEAWLDRRSGPAEAQAFAREVQDSLELQRELELHRRIEGSLARSFAPPPAASAGALAATARRTRAASWLVLAAAAAILASFGSWWRWAGRSAPAAPAGAFGAPLAQDSCELDRVFCDALAVDFQPLLGCQSSSEWDARLLASLGSRTCDADALLVLGEWRDARLEDSEIVLLRVGPEPVMLLVPRVQTAAAGARLCLPEGSPLHLHRGQWEGREVYELSKLTESRVLECVQAADVRAVRD